MNSIWKLVALSFLVANNFGGAMASANTKIMNLYKQKSYYAFEFTSTVNSIVTVSIIVGFMLGAMFASTLAKKFSKRKIGAIASAFACLFNLLSMVPVHWIYLAVMRVLLGASITTITTIIPGWLFDLSPAARRSLLSSTYQFFLTFGIFISSTVMLGIKSDVDKFWQAFLYDAVVNVACSFVCLSIKEETQVQTVQEYNQNVLESKNEITWGSKQLRRAKLTIVLFSIGSQISGINVVIMYATQIFQNYFDSPMSDVYGSLIAAGVNAASTLPALPFVSKFNRKTILFFGWFLMNLGHLLLIAAYVFDVQLLILIGSIVFLLGFEFGPGTMMVVVLGEIHPRKFNQQLNSFGYTIMWIVNIIVVITFPYFEKIVWAAYAIYFAVSFVCGVILCKTMPETRGRSSDEIDAEVLGIKMVKDEIIKEDLKIANETPVGRLNTAEQTVENEDK
ncbi:Hexose_transporter [Hexamita inflata]|uniref:Hexose transporter n=1 Tax=Hexamita inflata TaxID=28002 RepID=A0AA86N699_9EUKA|nr:Hexose transporter [Hexamita inflata]